MKGKALAQKALSALFLAAIIGALFVVPGKAALASVIGNVKPDISTKPPVITVSSPTNNSVTAETSVYLSFSVDVGESKTARSRLLHEIYYVTDWQQNRTQLLHQIFNEGSYVSGVSSTFVHNVSLSGIPEGNHNITVCADEWGAYTASEDSAFILMQTFSINSSATIYFTVDTTPPTVTVFAPMNLTYAPSGATLNFSVNEPASWMGYSLDGGENTTVAENVTLPELSVGQHMLRVYANDTAGNLGVSETVTFSIAEPETETFPTLSVAVASGASTAAVVAGVVVYWKKRKRKEGPA